MIVNGSKPLTFITKSSILDDAAVLDLPLPFTCAEKNILKLDHLINLAELKPDSRFNAGISRGFDRLNTILKMPLRHQPWPLSFSMLPFLRC